MKKELFCLVILLAFLCGCQPTKLQIAEKQYFDAKQQGLLSTQLIIIEELKVLAPNKYAELSNTKNQLMSTIKLLNSEESNYWNIPEAKLKQLTLFSPNAYLVKKVQHKNEEKTLILNSIKQLTSEIVNIRATIQEKLLPTPAHIITFPTKIRLSGLPQDILSHQYWQNIFTVSAALNNYQLEALLIGLTQMATKNEQLKEMQVQVSKIDSLYQISPQTFSNSDIEHIFFELYNQQLRHCYSWVIKQNKHLLYILNTGLGHQRLELLWQKSFEPVAKKAVLGAKIEHLEILEQISFYARKITIHEQPYNELYNDFPSVRDLMIGLLWPQEGLYKFAENSEKNKLLLQSFIKASSKLHHNIIL